MSAIGMVRRGPWWHGGAGDDGAPQRHDKGRGNAGWTRLRKKRAGRRRRAQRQGS